MTIKWDWAVYRVLMRPPAHTDPPTTARNTSSLSSGFAKVVSNFSVTQFAAGASREILFKSFQIRTLPIVRADDKLTAFAELEAEISHAQASAEPVTAYQARPYKNVIN